MGKKTGKKEQCGIKNLEANKRRKTERHENLLDEQEARKSTRLDLLEDLKAHFPGERIGNLKKKFGTLNINRIKDILDGKWEESAWFLNREAIREATEEALKFEKVFNGKSHNKNKFQKRDKIQTPSHKDKIQKVHSGSGNGNTKT